MDPPSRFSLQIVVLFFAAHLNHLEHFLYKAGYIHVSYCCQAFDFSVSFATVLATIYMCSYIYIRYYFVSLIIKIISFLSHPLGSHWSLSMCLGCSVLLQFTFYQNDLFYNTLDNVSSFLLSVRCCVLATLYISSDLNYLFIWNITIRQCVKLWFISEMLWLATLSDLELHSSLVLHFLILVFLEPSSGFFHYYIIKFWLWIVMQCDGEQKGVTLGWVR